MALTWAEKFDNFNDANPWVCAAMVKLARELKGVGHKRIGIAMLFEVLRWQDMRRTSDRNTAYKLCNNYKPFYARYIMENYKDLDGFFELREQWVNG